MPESLNKLIDTPPNRSAKSSNRSTNTPRSSINTPRSSINTPNRSADMPRSSAKSSNRSANTPRSSNTRKTTKDRYDLVSVTKGKYNLYHAFKAAYNNDMVSRLEVREIDNLVIAFYGKNNNIISDNDKLEVLSIIFKINIAIYENETLIKVFSNMEETSDEIAILVRTPNNSNSNTYQYDAVVKQ